MASPCENQEEKVVAVTGEDNSGDPAPTDSTEANGAVPAGDQAAPEAVTAERDENLAESDDLADAGPVASASDADGEAAAADAEEEEEATPDLEQESEI